MMRTANPALNDKAFQGEMVYEVPQPMTIPGTVNRTAVLVGLAIISAAYTWNRFSAGSNAVGPLIIGGAIGGFIVAIVTVFKKKWSPVTAPIYAILEGLMLGGISAIFNQQYPGIVINAVMLTFGVLAALLVAYKSGIIKATENFKLGVVAATGGVALVYLLSIVMGFFGVGIPFLHSNGPIGIGVSVVIVIIAALNLVLDFDFIENAADAGVPKYMEWYAAFGLMVTLVWLYLEILRLLAKLQSRR